MKDIGVDVNKMESALHLADSRPAPAGGFASSERERRELYQTGGKTPGRCIDRGMTRRRWLIAVGSFAALLLAAAAVLPPLLFGDRADYSTVQSVERDPTYHDPALLGRAFTLPVAAAYVNGGLDYQRNSSFCGPTTAVDVRRSLGTAADQKTILDETGFRSIFGFVWGGLTLDEEASLLRNKSGRPVTVMRDLSLVQFRAEMAHANDPGRRYTVNFARGPLFGRGPGHHSPIGGYLADRDLVLVLDVNARFKPWLVRTDRLLAAMNTVDKQSGTKRGLLRIE
jgi:hypothetical protein